MIDTFYLLYILWLESDLIGSYKNEIQAVDNKYILAKSGI